MKTKIFPPPLAPYSADDHQALIDEQRAQLDHYPWAPRILAALSGATLWGIAFILVLCVWISGNDSFGDITAAFSLGFIIPIIFSIPFLWR